MLEETIVLLIGPQNSGKTTLFNRLTGTYHKTVNYPGSTVSCEIGKLKSNPKTQVIDTPGISSVVAHSEDEAITLETIADLSTLLHGHSSKTADHIVLVLDQSQLSRQLAVFLQLKEAGVNPLVVLTMEDLLKKEGKSLNQKKLEEQLGQSVYLINPKTGKGLESLLEALKQKNKHKETTYQFPKTLETQTLTRQFNRIETIIQKVVKSESEATAFDLDTIFLHPILGIVIFISIMTFFFCSVFWIAKPFMEGIDAGVGALSNAVLALYPGQLIGQVVAEGIIQSIGSLLIFIPQIFILFVLIGLMEGSGFLARGAALVDKPLSYLGMNGRSFVPLLSGFACAIPAMLATRTIQNKREKLITVSLIPLMQCAARLPVYGLLISLLVGGRSMLGGILMTGIYMGSLIIAMIVGAILNKTLKKEIGYKGFHLELPRWRVPVIKDILSYAVTQTISFIKKAGPLIIGVGIVLWALARFPSPESSYAIQIGQWLNPIWSPLGVDGLTGSAILLSFAAREVFVSALGVMTQGNMPLFSISSSIALIVFFMISTQCGATLVTLKKETNSAKIAIATGLAYTCLAYVLAVGVRYILLRISTGF